MRFNGKISKRLKCDITVRMKKVRLKEACVWLAAYNVGGSVVAL